MSQKDYTGVPNWQLVQVIKENMNGERLTDVAARIPMDPRDFRSLIEGRTKFNGLALADRILLALDLNITVMEIQGKITIIPAVGYQAPRKMAMDEFWAKGIEPSSREITDRAHELARLRDEMLSRN